MIAMIAFLRKAERTEVLPFVHGGWLSALVAGGLTWVAATYLIGISGAGRELVEGFGSLFAALVLLSVGIWMHGKSQAGEWQRYIQKTMQHALSRRSAWFLFGLAFLVVYREVFETIFLRGALDSGACRPIGGAASAVVLLANRLGDAALQSPAADWNILRVQLDPDRHSCRRSGREGHFGPPGSRSAGHHPASGPAPRSDSGHCTSTRAGGSANPHTRPDHAGLLAQQNERPASADAASRIRLAALRSQESDMIDRRSILGGAMLGAGALG